MKFEHPAGPNPIDQMKVVGRPHDRIDGPLKTTGEHAVSVALHTDVVVDVTVAVVGETV